jgi:lipoate-protein ligase A
MAADEALLRSAAQGTASLRLYTWTETTLSLGYFQAAGPARANARRAVLPWVRRASGGAALVHHHELTYCLALPAGAPWQNRAESWLARMHAILRDALANLHVRTALCTVHCERCRGETLCFAQLAPNDLLLNEVKVAGSAQRKLRGALMQHGGILLARSQAAPELPGIQELTGRLFTPSEVSSAITSEFARATGWEITAGSWTSEELDTVAELEVTKYAHASWNEKR